MATLTLQDRNDGNDPESNQRVGSFLTSPDLVARILDLADDAVIVLNHLQRITLFNPGAEKIFGYSRYEVIGQPLDLLLPSALAEAHRRHIYEFSQADVAARRMGERREIKGRRKNGSEFPAEASISKVEIGGRTMFAAILRDVTRRVQNEAKIRASLREKEVLLREIHHRVKNNLQVVSSLLGLQARAVDDPEIHKMFEESQNRIHSMALLHESLYRSDNLARIDFSEYVQELAAHLFQSYRIGDRVRLRTNLTKIFLNLDVAVPCGLIINELVSNSLRHAFPEGRDGEVLVELHQVAADKATLLVADNGVGISQKAGANSLGMRLVRTLSEQLGSQIQVSSSSAGTEVKLTFTTPAEADLHK